MPYSERYNAAVKSVINIEGYYSDHSDDPGGKTKYGITEQMARTYEYDGKMKDLSKEQAKSIYYQHYWVWLHLEEISAIAPKTAEELFEASINIGRRTVWRWMQRTLNVLNRQERDYKDIATDGIPGPKSMQAFRAFVGMRSEADDVMARSIDSLQGHHYIKIAENDEQFESFVYGWFRQRVS